MSDNDELRYKLKDFCYNEYKNDTIYLRKKKVDFKEECYYPDILYK